MIVRKSSILFFIFGFFSINYIALVGPVKIADVSLLIVCIIYFKYIKRISYSVFLVWLFVIISMLSTCVGFISDGFFGISFFEYMKTFINAILALFGLTLMSNIPVNDQLNFVRGLVISSISISIFSLLIYFEILPSLGAPVIYKFSYGKAIQGLMTDPNRFGVVLLIFHAITLARATCRKNKITWVFLSGLAAIFVFFTGSRGAFLVSCFNILFFLVYQVFFSKYLKILYKFFIVLTILCSSFFCFFYLKTSDINFVDKVYIFQKFQNKGNLSEDPRAENYHKMISSVFDYPLGMGFLGFKKISDKTSHSTLIETFVCSGFIGVLGLGGFYLLQFKRILKAIRLKSLSNEISDIYHQQLFLWITFIPIFLYVNLHFLLFSYLMMGLISNRSKV